MPRRLFNLFLFSSVYIALCAIIMVYQTIDLLHVPVVSTAYFRFVFFSTLCSYNFHWYLTPGTPQEEMRVGWTQRHKRLHLVLFAIGFIGAGVSSFVLLHHLAWIAIAVLLTFLYSAPKISIPPFSYLRRIAVGKTIFLAFVWTYVTTVLPLIIFDTHFYPAQWMFCTSRFFLVYAICVIFDYRDRPVDKSAGIRSLITYFSEAGVNNIFYISLACFAAVTVCLGFYGFSWLTVFCLLIPGTLTLSLFKVAKRNFSDYLYYFVLDGLMMFSAIFTALI